MSNPAAQAGSPLEFGGVGGHQDEIAAARLPGDQRIVGVDGRARPLQGGPDRTGGAFVLLVERQHLARNAALVERELNLGVQAGELGRHGSIADVADQGYWWLYSWLCESRNVHFS